jgi:hypothetical protein
VEREYAAARSIQSIAPADASVKSAVDRLVSRFELAVTSVSESLPPLPKPSMQPIAAMASKIPARVGPMKSYMEKRRDIKAVKNFHSIMAYEALNFADGRRTVWQIYEALRAQSLASGEWYYGRVTPEMVRELFDNAEKAGAVTTKASPAATQPPSRRRR